MKAKAVWLRMSFLLLPSFWAQKRGADVRTEGETLRIRRHPG
jgi:hypothetical protein